MVTKESVTFVLLSLMRACDVLSTSVFNFCHPAIFPIATLGTFKTQKQAIDWANANSDAPLVARGGDLLEAAPRFNSM
jgi:hypothetical protein